MRGRPELLAGAREWVTARVGACEDAAARDPAAAARLAGRLTCLERWRNEALGERARPLASPGLCPTTRSAPAEPGADDTR